MTMDLPFVCAWVRLDGADVPFAHLLDEVPAEEVEVGLRVEAVWVPDRGPRPDLGEHPVLPSRQARHGRRRPRARMTRVAVVGAASEVVLTSDGRNDAELLAPVVERALTGQRDLAVRYRCGGHSQLRVPERRRGRGHGSVRRLPGVAPPHPFASGSRRSVLALRVLGTAHGR